ncbi:hypothetical protein LTR65_000013 [Meristemomyces frigidus]
MEAIGSDSETQNSPEQPSLVLTPGTEQRVDLWQQTGSFPYPDLQVFPPPHTQEYSKNELRLIHHLTSVSNDLLLKGTTNLAIWTQKMPKFLSIASSYPYVMQALFSFSANHLAWVHSSTETRNLANADAVLAASLLLQWQATDWRSWSSLRAGIRSILTAMQSWKHESLFADYIAEEDLSATAFRSPLQDSSVDPTERHALLQNALYALQRLQMSLTEHDMELSWVNQLFAYVQRLQGMNAAQTPEEQFNYLYQLRKWLAWVPVSLLQRQGGQGPALLTLAHFYATALALEPLFPDLGSSFCSAMALPPLDAIIRVTDAMQSQHGMGPSAMEIASLMQYPQQAVLAYRSRAMQSRQAALQQESPMLGINPDTFSYTTFGNLSPAFTPSTPAYDIGQASSACSTPFLEVPLNQSSFTYGTQSWGAMPSPSFPPQTFTTQEEQIYDYSGMSLGDFRGGFVPPATIWT